MGRAIIGTGSGYGSRPKIRLDDDCDARPMTCRPCGTAPGPDDTELGALRYVEISLRVRQGFDDEGVPMFGWTPLVGGRSFLNETREEWDAEAGVTVVHATMMIANPTGLDSVPETAVVVEPSSGTVWQISSTAVTPDRIEVKAYRTWAEVPGPAPTTATERSVLDQMDF